MGIRKRVRTKWKAERKENIRKVSLQRLKKAQKLAAKTNQNPTTTAAPTKAKVEKKVEDKVAA